MKKFLALSLLWLSLGSGVTALGAHVSPQEALNRLAQSHNGHRTAASKMSVKSCKTLDHLYVFENEDGFIILPDDDRAPALLGYCDDTSFVAKNPSFKAWLDFYNAELSSLSDVEENVGVIRTDGRPSREPISPLIVTKWNQREPYNDLCPELDDERSVTGCVATAMAQVMKYHNWPERGTGTHSYYWENGNRDLSFDFGATTFDWDNMLPVYDETATEEQRKAVATLMSACGVAADMKYSPVASGANMTNAARGMVEYLNYDQGLSMAYRAWYGLYEWEDMIYGELADNRPVLYSGESQTAGHAFVCDGYAGDGFFHINWGWGGYCDGYFLLTALTPDGQGIGGGSPDGYNKGQSVFIGLKPRTSDSERSYLFLGYEFYPYSDFEECHIGDTVWCYAGIYNYSLWASPDGSSTGVKITSESGEVTYAMGMSYDGMEVNWGYANLSFTVPSLRAGKYTVTPVYRIENGPWMDVRMMIGRHSSCDLVVSEDGSCEFVVPESNLSLVPESVNYPSIIYTGCQFPLSFTVKNTTSNEFYGAVRPVLLDMDTWDIVAESGDFTLDVMPGQVEQIDNVGCTFKSANDEDLTPGQYRFALVCDNGALVSGLGYWYLYFGDVITLEEAPEEVKIEFTDFTLTVENPIKNPSEVTFDFGIKCEEGYFCDNLIVFFYTLGEDRYNYTGLYCYTPLVSLSGGEEYNGTVTTDLSSLENGEYYAFLFCGEEYTGGVKLEIMQDLTSVTEVSSGEQENVIYDLCGRRVYGNLLPGIYIRNGRKIMVR